MATMQLGLLVALAAAASATVKEEPCRQPLKIGPCEALVPRWYFSAKQGRCLKFNWGGCKPNGNNFESLKDCEKQCCASGCGKPCEQPLKVGPCRAAIPRFYYSAKDGKCMEFSWGGCQPNGNNFKTLADCNKQCNPCLQPKKVGPCKARMPRYYFSAKANRCLKFYWGGCKPNGNNFRTLSECRQSCGAGRPKLCRLPKVVGLCLAAIPRYYFNGKRCAQFTYGGCGGNANNFRTVDECRKTCRAQGIWVSTKLLIKQLTSADKQPEP